MAFENDVPGFDRGEWTGFADKTRHAPGRLPEAMPGFLEVYALGSEYCGIFRLSPSFTADRWA